MTDELEPPADLVETLARALADVTDEVWSAGPEQRCEYFRMEARRILPTIVTAIQAQALKKVAKALELRQGLFGGEPMTANEAAIARHMLDAIRALFERKEY